MAIKIGTEIAGGFKIGTEIVGGMKVGNEIIYTAEVQVPAPDTRSVSIPYARRSWRNERLYLKPSYEFYPQYFSTIIDDGKAATVVNSTALRNKTLTIYFEYSDATGADFRSDMNVVNSTAADSSGVSIGGWTGAGASGSYTTSINLGSNITTALNITAWANRTSHDDVTINNAYFTIT